MPCVSMSKSVAYLVLFAVLQVGLVSCFLATGILMSPFAISVSSVSNSIEEGAEDGAGVVQVCHVRCLSKFLTSVLFS